MRTSEARVGCVGSRFDFSSTSRASRLFDCQIRYAARQSPSAWGVDELVESSFSFMKLDFE